MAGLYIHIPFCKKACHYCDFHFSTKQDTKGNMVEALCKEMELQRNYLGESINTIYFGGGTPSLLSGIELKSLFDSITRNFSVHAEEITLESNPDDLTKENIAVFKETGINRLSIGIQSFDDQILKFLNRSHSSLDATTSFLESRKIGFNNISIDLIYAIPGQDNNLWKRNVEKAIAMNPEHISAYSLTIEEKTVFGNWRKKGKMVVESDEVAAVQMEMLIDLLGKAGYQHYEISNFCKPNFHSKHNSSYWEQKKYLGIGPSAHSYNGVSRQFNIPNNQHYLHSIREGKLAFEMETLSRANKINEYLLTTLRTERGCDVNYLIGQFDYNLLNQSAQLLEVHFKSRLIEKRDHLLILTPKGKLFADKIAADFFVSE